MFDIPPLSAVPPASLEDALLQTQNFFSQAGLENAEVSITHPAEAGETLRGGCLEATLPLQALDEVTTKAAQTLASSQGVKITHSRLTLQNNPTTTLCLTLLGEVAVRVMGATVTVQVRGIADGSGGETLQCRALQLDVGSGIFAGMATALIRPRLDALEGKRFELSQIAGVPVRLIGLECSEAAPFVLRVGLQFV